MRGKILLGVMILSALLFVGRFKPDPLYSLGYVGFLMLSTYFFFFINEEPLDPELEKKIKKALKEA